VEDVGAILVDQHSSRVSSVKGIAGHMRTLVDDQHPFVALAREAFSQDASGKPSADHQPIIHVRLPLAKRD
jgi:hypothetical protein